MTREARFWALTFAVLAGAALGVWGANAGMAARQYFTRPPAVQPAPAPRANPSPVLTSTGGAA